MAKGKAKEPEVKEAEVKQAEVKQEATQEVAAEKPAKAAKAKAAAKEKKWEYTKPLRPEFVKVGEKKVRVSIPAGKDAEGKKLYDQFFAPKSWANINKDGSVVLKAPPGRRHDDVSVMRAGADKPKTVPFSELQNASHSIVFKKAKKAEATKEADKKADKSADMEM